MTLWKLADPHSLPTKLAGTTLPAEHLLEERLEHWIAHDPSLLGEPLLIIGRQVQIAELNHKIDLLALDTEGNSVVIEIKRGQLKGPVEMQGIRYASYVSRWQDQHFADQARVHLGHGEADFDFTAQFEKFCQNEGVEQTPVLNHDQRIIVVGSDVHERVLSSALWLRARQVDISVVQIDLSSDGGSMFLQSRVVVPVPGAPTDVGAPARSSTGKDTSGRSWHLDKRCSPATSKLLLRLVDLIQDELHGAVQSPKWDQRYYVAFPVANHNWLIVVTRRRRLELRFLVKAGSFDAAPLAQQLGLVAQPESDDEEPELAEASGPGSSSTVAVKARGPSDRVVVKLDGSYDISRPAFVQFLKDTYAAFPHAGPAGEPGTD